MKRTIIICALVITVCAVGSAGAARLITGAQIKNGSIGSADLAPSVKRALFASKGLTAVEIVDGPEVTLLPGEHSADAERRTGIELKAECPRGKTVIGTGFYNSIATVGFVKSYDFFVGAAMSNDSSIEVGVSVQATCAKRSSAVAATASDAAGRFDADKAAAAAQVAR